MEIDVARTDPAGTVGLDDDVIDLRLNDLDDVDEGADMAVWVTVAEAAEKAGLSTSTVRQWYRSGRVPTQRAEGEGGAFLVPLDAVMELARVADETGDGVGAEVIDLNADYWSEETRLAREEAAAAREVAEAARQETAAAEAAIAAGKADVGRLEGELDQANQQLEFLRAQLGEAAEAERTAKDEADRQRAEVTRLTAEVTDLGRELDESDDEVERLEAAMGELEAAKAELETAKAELETAKAELEADQATMTDELTQLRAMTGRAASITDNSWLDMQTPAYQSPVRPQQRLERTLGGVTDGPDAASGPTPRLGTGLANLLAHTVADGPRAGGAAVSGTVDDGSEGELGEDGEAPEDEVVEEGPAPAPFAGFGLNEDDLLPDDGDKKRRRR